MYYCVVQVMVVYQLSLVCAQRAAENRSAIPKNHKLPLYASLSLLEQNSLAKDCLNIKSPPSTY